MRAAYVILYGLLMGTAALSGAAADELLQPDADGWHTWQMEQPAVSTEMCCFTWNGGNKSRKGCNLDAHSVAFSDSGDCAVAPGTVQIYVRLSNGKPKDIRVLSSNCPVSTESDVADHGLVTVNENIRWFRSIIEDRHVSNDVREEALFGLVQTESDAAFDYLDRLLSKR